MALTNQFLFAGGDLGNWHIGLHILGIILLKTQGIKKPEFALERARALIFKIQTGKVLFPSGFSRRKPFPL